MIDPTLANNRPILPTPRCKEWSARAVVEIVLAVPAVFVAVRPRTNPDIFGVTSGDAISVSLPVNNQLFVTLDLSRIILSIGNNNLIFLCIFAVQVRVSNTTEIKHDGVVNLSVSQPELWTRLTVAM